MHYTQEDWEFKVILSFLASSRPAWATGDFVSKKNKMFAHPQTQLSVFYGTYSEWSLNGTLRVCQIQLLLQKVPEGITGLVFVWEMVVP